MATQRGFIGLAALLVIVLGLIVIGGGVYYIKHQNAVPQSAQNLPELPSTQQAPSQATNISSQSAATTVASIASTDESNVANPTTNTNDLLNDIPGDVPLGQWINENQTFNWVPVQNIHDPLFGASTFGNGTIMMEAYDTSLTIDSIDPATFLVAVRPDGKVANYAKDKNGVYYLLNYLPGASGGAPVTGADPNTFTVLAYFPDIGDTTGIDLTYAKDKNNVYIDDSSLIGINPALFSYVGDGLFNYDGSLYWVDLTGAPYTSIGVSYKNASGIDVSSLASAGGPWFEDKNHAYCAGSHDTLQVLNADRKTFEGLSFYYAKDAQHVFTSNTCGILSGAAPNSFTVLNDTYAKDDNGAYYGGAAIQGADPSTFTAFDNVFAKDSKNVYVDGYGSNSLSVLSTNATGGTPQQNISVDPATFVVLDDYFLKDVSHVFQFDQGSGLIFSVTDADPATFVVLSDEYEKDKNYVYDRAGNIISGADPNTFQLINGSSTAGARDKNHEYLDGRVVQ